MLCVEWRKREYSSVSFIFKMRVHICIYTSFKKKNNNLEENIWMVGLWVFGCIFQI